MIETRVVVQLGKGNKYIWVQDRFCKLWFSSSFQSTRSRDNAGRTEFRYAAVFEGSSLKRLLVEVCDLAFDSSSCKGWR